MSDRLEEIRSRRAELTLYDDIDWLIEEVERLREENTELKWDGALNEAEERIESLTRERDEWRDKLGEYTRSYERIEKKLEAENAELKAGWDQTSDSLGKLADDTMKLNKKLTTSEKARQDAEQWKEDHKYDGFGEDI